MNERMNRPVRLLSQKPEVLVALGGDQIAAVFPVLAADGDGHAGGVMDAVVDELRLGPPSGPGHAEAPQLGSSLLAQNQQAHSLLLRCFHYHTPLLLPLLQHTVHPNPGSHCLTNALHFTKNVMAGPHIIVFTIRVPTLFTGSGDVEENDHIVGLDGVGESPLQRVFGLRAMVDHNHHFVVCCGGGRLLVLRRRLRVSAAVETSRRRGAAPGGEHGLLQILHQAAGFLVRPDGRPR